MFFLGSAVFGMWYFVSLYLQQVLGYSPLRAGLAFVPMTLAIVVGSALASRGVTRGGPSRCSYRDDAPGGGTAALLARSGRRLLPERRAGAVRDRGLGIGLAFVPVTIAAVAGVARARPGWRPGS